MAGRLNKILEFIGLVDDEPEEGMDQGRRPVGGQTYGTQSRRSAPQGASRSGYDDPRNRYTSSRPDYDARSRRSEPFGGSRYSQDYGKDYRSGNDGYGDYQSSRYSHQGMPYSDYRSQQRNRDYGTEQSSQGKDPFEEAFDRDNAKRAARSASREQQGNVVPMRPAEPSRQTVIYYLHQLEECRDVINDLLDNKTVLLNLEDMDERVVQRGIDTLCGAAFALGATLRKASDKTYLIAPKSVEVASTNETERRF